MPMFESNEYEFYMLIFFVGISYAVYEGIFTFLELMF